MRGRVSSTVGFSFCVASVALAALAGCGRPETAADHQFAEMREQVSRMEAENDKRDQRLGAVEDAIDDEKSTRAEKPGSMPAPQAARVVQLGGPSDSDAADPNDPAARPDIRVTGVPGAAPMRPRSGKSGGRARVEESDPGVRTDAPRSSALDPDAKSAYETALAQVQAKQYDRGLEGLNAFLVRWPDHPYVENALYWRGEAYFAQGEYLRAAEQFESVLARPGSGNKAPDALLKLGMCHDRLGASQRAREYWDRLKNDFPRSDAAKRIPAAGRKSSGTSTGAREDSSPDRKGPKENR
jgi:tol-pal system protein YbgF